MRGLSLSTGWTVVCALIAMGCLRAAYGADSESIPRAGRPATTLTVLDTTGLAPDERLCAVSVQGLVNRKKPRIWLKGVAGDDHWLGVLRGRGLVREVRQCGSLTELMTEYRSEISGLVITDPELVLSVNIATMIAAVRGFAIASPELAPRLPIPVKADLRGRWANQDEALRWAYKNLWPSMSRAALAWACPGERFHCERDYYIQNKLWLLWINSAEDEGKLGCNRAVEMLWTEKILKQTPGNIPVFGFPANGHGFHGIGEMGGTTIASAYGKYNVCSNLNTNLSVHSGYPSARLKQKPVTAPEFDATKAYVAFVLSDGDNLLTWNSYYLSVWKQRPADRPAISWTIGPVAAVVMPEIVRWYYQNAVPGDTFIADHSGAGYMYPAIWGAALGDRSLEAGYIRLTARLCDMLDIRTVALHDYLGTSFRHLQAYESNWPGLVAILADYTRRRSLTASWPNYRLPGGLPVMHAVVSFNDSTEREKRISSVVDDIREAAGSRPAFLNAFLVNWHYGPDDCAEIMRRLGSDFVAVAPEVLSKLAAGRVAQVRADPNAALSAWAHTRRTNRVDTHAATRFENARYACDGDLNTYWDEDDGASEYRLILDFPDRQRVGRIELVGYQHEHYAPKSLDIVCDGRKVVTIDDLRYTDNLADIHVPRAACRRMELRIFRWYGGSPGIREVRVFED